MLPRGAQVPSLDEIFEINRRVFEHYRFGYPLPGPNDFHATRWHQFYARVWSSMAGALAQAGRGEDAAFARSLAAELAPRAKDAVTVGVRPEHLLTQGGAGPTLNLKVDTVEALGADSLLHCVLDSSTLVVRVDGHEPPAAGTAIAVQAMPGKTYFFDTDTGKRL